MSPATLDEVCIESNKYCFQFRRLRDFPIAQGFGTRLHDATLRGDELSIRNREQFFSSFGLPLDNVVSMTQIHGNNIMLVSYNDRGRGARSGADALSSVDG